MDLKTIARLKQIKGYGYLSVKITFCYYNNPSLFPNYFTYLMQVTTPTIFGERVVYSHNFDLTHEDALRKRSPFSIIWSSYKSISIPKSDYIFPPPNLLILNPKQRKLVKQFYDIENVKCLFYYAIQEEATLKKKIYRNCSSQGLWKTVFFPSLETETHN